VGILGAGRSLSENAVVTRWMASWMIDFLTFLLF